LSTRGVYTPLSVIPKNHTTISPDNYRKLL